MKADLSIFGEDWAMEPGALSALYLRVSGEPRAELPPEQAASDRRHSVGPVYNDRVATVHLRGTMMKRVPDWARWYGLDAVATGDVAKALEEAAADPEARAIVLRIDSPGGQLSGVQELGELVRSIGERKPIHAVVEDTCASAAYWVASAAKSVSAPASGRVGSIGVYMVAVDSSQRAADAGIKVHVVASGPLKGLGEPGTPITDDHLAHMKSLVDGSAKDFMAAVARGRRMDAEKVKGLATGRIWRSAEAVAHGLIDRSEPAGSAMARVTKETGERYMAEQTELETARATAREEERARVRGINAAFPEDPEFCRDQIDKGATLEQASVAFIPRMRERAKAQAEKAAAELATAKKTPPPAPEPGTKPVPHGEAGAAPAGDFMEQARARAEVLKEKGVKRPMTTAMRELATKQPELYASWRAGVKPVAFSELEKADRIKR